MSSTLTSPVFSPIASYLTVAGLSEWPTSGAFPPIQLKLKSPLPPEGIALQLTASPTRGLEGVTLQFVDNTATVRYEAMGLKTGEVRVLDNRSHQVAYATCRVDIAPGNGSPVLSVTPTPTITSTPAPTIIITGYCVRDAVVVYPHHGVSNINLYILRLIGKI